MQIKSLTRGIILCSLVATTVAAGGGGEGPYKMQKYGVLGKRPPIYRASSKVEEAKSKEEAWRYWAEADRAAYIDDTYAMGLHPYWREENGVYNKYWDHSTKSKFGVGLIGRSYHDYDGLVDYRIHRANQHEYDYWHMESLNAQRRAAQADVLSAGIDIVGGGHAPAEYSFWLGYQFAVQDSAAELEIAYRNGEEMEIDAAHRALESTQLWNLAFAFDLFPRIKDEEAYKTLALVAAATDLNHMYETYDDADYLYHKDPNEANWHAREVAGILVDAAQNEFLWGYSKYDDEFATKLDGFATPIFEYQTYNKWSQASRYEADYAAHVYHEKYGRYPEHEYKIHLYDY